MEGSTRRSGLLDTYKVVIAVITLLTVAGALLALFLGPAHYVSSARVVVQPEALSGGAPLPPNMGTEQQIALSGAVTDLAALRLGLADQPDVAVAGLSVSVPVDTTVLEFSYSASSAETAYSRAGVFARAYVAYRTRAAEKAPQVSGTNAPSTPARVPVAEIISEPTLATGPVKPNYPLVVGLSLMVGAMLGTGFAFVWDRVSGKLRGIDDIQSQTELPVLASVPTLKTGAPTGIPVGSGQSARGAEAFGPLTARIAHLLDKRQASSLLITSPSKGAGKSTIAANIATSLAVHGKPTVLVSADFRDATLKERFGFDRQPGLSDVLRGTASLAVALHATDVEGLRLLTSGSAARPGEAMVNVEEVALLLERLAVTEGVVVIIDAAAVLGNSETALLADHVDLVLMVVDLRHDSRADASSAASMLAHTEGAVVGIVANDPGRRHAKRSSPDQFAVRPARAASDVHPGIARLESEPADGHSGS